MKYKSCWDVINMDNQFLFLTKWGVCDIVISALPDYENKLDILVTIHNDFDSSWSIDKWYHDRKGKVYRSAIKEYPE